MSGSHVFYTFNCILLIFLSSLYHFTPIFWSDMVNFIYVIFDKITFDFLLPIRHFGSLKQHIDTV